MLKWKQFSEAEKLEDGASTNLRPSLLCWIIHRVSSRVEHILEERLVIIM
ncbi:predicted protein [Botrytis cinerea T4]|uniref:Uncharacterized protein n=1 Tax=Botryotinia fuckeliana (strain T4) TaxID=999810 RepID=G2YBY1_BOTF4|nr:predicted protein [Botrytis cinerea T4]